MSRHAVPRAACFAVPAVAAPIQVWWMTRADGLGISPDSVAYLAAANGLAEGAGVVGPDGEPQSLYAPALSWLLTLAASRGAAVGAAHAVNLVALAAVVFGLGWWLDRHLRRSVAVVAAGAAAVAAPLLSVHAWLWSEPLYILLTAVYLAVLVRVGTEDRTSPRWVAGAGLVAAAATLVRYAGISLLPIALLVLLLRPGGWYQRISRTAVFGVAYAVPVGAWLLRNAVLTGDVAGERVGNTLSAGATFQDGVLTVAGWLTPEDWPLPVRLWSSALLAVGVAVLTAAVWRNRRVDRRSTVLAVLVGYVVSAFLSIFAMTASANVNALGPRLLSPLVVPIVALLAVCGDLVLDRLPAPGKATCAVLAVVAVGWCLLPPTVRQVSADRQDVVSYDRGRWLSESSRDLVAGAPSGSTVVSNDPWGVYYLRGIPVGDSPRAHYHASHLVPPRDLDDLAQAVRSGPTYLVWFDRPGSDYHYRPAELDDHFALTPVERSGTGVVYRVTADS